jgi:hypothetical protein
VCHLTHDNLDIPRYHGTYFKLTLTLRDFSFNTRDTVMSLVEPKLANSVQVTKGLGLKVQSQPE